MSCIAAVIHNGKVIMGGDSIGVGASGEVQLRKDTKVFTVGPYIIGTSGSWAVNHALRDSHRFSETPNLRVTEIDQFMRCSLLNDIKIALHDYRVQPEDIDKSEILVGFKGHIFHLYGTSQVSEELLNFEACGSGAQVARGAMFRGLGYTESPRDFVRNALEAAERFCSTVRGPFTILEEK